MATEGEATTDQRPTAEEAETVAAKEKKPKARKEKKPKQSTKTISHPPYFQMITEALTGLQEKGGSSPYAIAKYMGEKHKDELPPNFRKILAVQLKHFAAKGNLVKVKASYKLSQAAAGKKETRAKTKAPKKKTRSVTAAAKIKAEAAAAAAPPPKKAKRSTAAKPKQPKSIKSPAAKKAKKATA